VGFAFSLSSLLDFRLWKKKPSKAAERWVVNNLITYLQFFFSTTSKKFITLEITPLPLTKTKC
jgi:hypothetical protein